VKGLECRLLSPEFADSLGDLFEVCQKNGDERFFYPHSLTREEAYRLSHYEGADAYYVLLFDEEVIGYGLERGYDEGYGVPTSGRLIHPQFRDCGIGTMFTRFLYASAFLRGADEILVHIEPDNIASLVQNMKMGHAPDFDGKRFCGKASLGKQLVANQIDSLIRSAVVKWFLSRTSLECEKVPDEEFIASETIGEVIEKMVILNIRIWYLVGKALGLEDADEWRENMGRIDHCYKIKRPRLVVCLNRMLKALARGQFDLAEDMDVKDYAAEGMLDRTN